MEELVAIVDEEFLAHKEGTQMVLELQKAHVKTRIYRLPVKESILCKRFRIADGQLNVVDEHVALVRLKARLLTEMVEAQTARDYFEKVQAVYKGMTIIFMIEGLNTYYRKCRAAMNREFLDAIQALDSPDGTDSENRKPRTRPIDMPVDKKIVDSFLVRTQIELRVQLAGFVGTVSGETAVLHR
jgi:hypothetical protein